MIIPRKFLALLINFGNSSNFKYRTRNPFRSRRPIDNRAIAALSAATTFATLQPTLQVSFIYQGRNKQQWATLQSKIRTRLATQNIQYLEDEIEIARRTTPPAPAVTLHAPAHYIESAAGRDDRIRQQKQLNDDDLTLCGGSDRHTISDRF